MKRKRHTPQEIIAKLREAEVDLNQGSGYRRMTRLLRREEMQINKKRVQRLWREEGLRNPLQKRRKRARGHSENSCAMKKAEYKNHLWCWDFP